MTTAGAAGTVGIISLPADEDIVSSADEAAVSGGLKPLAMAFHWSWLSGLVLFAVRVVWFSTLPPVKFLMPSHALQATVTGAVVVFVVWTLGNAAASRI